MLQQENNFDEYHTADITEAPHEFFLLSLHYAMTPSSLIARTAC